MDLLGLGLPWAAGVLAETAAIAALKDPTAPSLGQAFAAPAGAVQAAVPATNRGPFGYAFDATTSPNALALIQLRMGTLGADGDWVDGEVTPIARGWRFRPGAGQRDRVVLPDKRLTLDVDAASPLTRNAADEATWACVRGTARTSTCRSTPCRRR